MSNSNNQIAQALLSAQQPVQASTSPFTVDPRLEQNAANLRPTLHPLVQAIMNRLGLLGMVRNTGNEQIDQVNQVLNQ